MAKYEASVLIDRPVEDVWKFIMDLSNLTKITPSAPKLQPISPGPLGLGSTFSGKEGRVTLVARITKYDPNRRFVGEFIAPGFLKGTTDDYVLVAVDGKTKLTETWDTKLNGFFRLLRPFFARRTKRDVTTRLNNLKRLLESGTSS